MMVAFKNFSCSQTLVNFIDSSECRKLQWIFFIWQTTNGGFSNISMFVFLFFIINNVTKLDIGVFLDYLKLIRFIIIVLPMNDLSICWIWFKFYIIVNVIWIISTLRIQCFLVKAIYKWRCNVNYKHSLFEIS